MSIGNPTRSAASLIVALAVMATGVHAQSEGFSALDRNLDEILERGEFEDNFRGRGVFSSLDLNADDRLTAGELSARYGEDPRFEQRFGGDITSLDSDRSGSLDRDEFSIGVYDRYDQDLSGTLDENEFGAYADDTGDGGIFDQSTIGAGSTGVGGDIGGGGGIGGSGGGSALAR